MKIIVKHNNAIKHKMWFEKFQVGEIMISEKCTKMTHFSCEVHMSTVGYC